MTEKHPATSGLIDNDILILLGTTIASSLLLYLLIWSLGGRNVSIISENFDGPMYALVAESLYDPSTLVRIGAKYPLPALYYAAHLPLYPLLIRALSFVGYQAAAVFTTQLSTLALVVVVYRWLKRFGFSEKPFFLVFVFLFFPARFFVLRSVGSSEPLFMLFLLLSTWSFWDKKYVQAGLFGALAQMTRFPGVLLIPVYLLYLLYSVTASRRENQPMPADLLSGTLVTIGTIATTLGAVFSFYYARFGDFWAYFHAGSETTLTFIPYGNFNFLNPRVASFFLDEFIIIFLAGYITAFILWNKNKLFSLYTAVFSGLIIFIDHRDLMRYAAPLFPMWLTVLAPLARKKAFRYSFFLILPAVYLYAFNFVQFNRYHTPHDVEIFSDVVKQYFQVK